MDLCSNGHEEVCYEGRQCPACELYDETKKEYDAEFEKLEDQISELKEELKEERNK